MGCIHYTIEDRSKALKGDVLIFLINKSYILRMMISFREFPALVSLATLREGYFRLRIWCLHTDNF